MQETLPIDAHLPRLVSHLQQQAAVVLQAPTGAGKTTRVPLAIAEAFPKQIIVLQPRRLAARGVAQRMADQTGTRVGQRIGYHVRFDNKTSSETKIVVMTDGLYLRVLQSNPFLDGVSAVVFDEFHERNINSDLALALTRQVQQELDTDLKLVVMSATLEPEPISAYLGGCPTIVTEGRSFPVELVYAPYPSTKRIADRCVDAVLNALTTTDDDILVFLPGVGEINDAYTSLQHHLRNTTVELSRLHGSLPLHEQQHAIRPIKRQKVVLATNIAETSITVPSIRTVIDSGLARVNRLDSTTGFNRLDLEPISQASATQRAGRAGRTAPGRCFRLWTEREERARSPHLEPEIHRADCCDAVLMLLQWGEPDCRLFNWFESPHPDRLEQAHRVLSLLGAIEGGTISQLGQQLAALPIHPRLGTLMLAAARGHFTQRGAAAAALLSERDPFEAGTRFDEVGSCDIEVRLNALESGHPRLNRHRERALRQVIAHLKQAVRSKGFHQTDADALGKALLAAFPDRVARRRSPGSDRALLVGGKGVRLHPDSIVTQHELFLCLRMKAGRSGPRSEATVFWASAIEPSWLSTERRIDIRFDAETERVKACEQEHFNGLTIRERPAAIPADRAVGDLLFLEAKRHLDRLVFTAPELKHLRDRVQWLGERRETLGLPALDPSFFEELVELECADKKSFNELRSVNWAEKLRQQLGWEQRQQLETLAPERLAVPSGSQIRLTYTPGKPPVLRVRIQELFGLKTTPTVDGGRVPVLLHLLAPNMRTQQITSDLESFWSTGYREVRKELRQRYPKHAWPEDPTTAPPERRPKRRRS